MGGTIAIVIKNIVAGIYITTSIVMLLYIKERTNKDYDSKWRISQKKVRNIMIKHYNLLGPQ